MKSGSCIKSGIYLRSGEEFERWTLVSGGGVMSDASKTVTISFLS